MKIIFAQGNPGNEYASTRHNVGFLALEALRRQYEGASWKKAARSNAEVSEITIKNQKVLLVRPLSFYNETGPVARALIDFYKLDPSSDFVVIHDDLALPFGTIRTREKGSDAGNNGIKSLNQHLDDQYARVRVGIWNDLRDRIDDADFVLSRFSVAEQKALETSILPVVVTLIENFIDGTLESTSLRH